MAPPPHFLHPCSRIPLSAPLVLFLLLLLPSVSVAVNVTAILAAHSDFSGFNRLLSSSPVAGDLTRRSSLTLLAVPNAYLLRSGDLGHSTADIADVLRYHVLLEYLSWAELRRIPAAGKLVTTLYQTTGRAFNNLGAVNLTRDPRGGSVTAHSPVPYSSSNATILSLVESLPYNVSIFAVDALLVPYGFDLAASESRPAAAPVNITRVLFDGRDFNVAASMLEASGVAGEFDADERGAGITVFVPTDEAFAELPVTERLQSLPAERKAVVLRFHVLPSYYPLGSLESILNPVQPTLATEATEAGRFTLNITRVNGSVAIDTGVVQASITRTVFDQNPVAVFAVSRVLLPKEIFGKDSAGGGGPRPGPGSGAEAAPPPEQPGASAPEGPDGVETPPTRLSSPPGFKGNIRSSAARYRGSIFNGVALLCIGYLYLLLQFSWPSFFETAILEDGDKGISLRESFPLCHNKEAMDPYWT
ncbi:fasciclin-like arabinogalactan protein 4 isoform X2 [Elaeis guineensis]|uniref:fasciclin-like arabinogalactan protein 4 isoform X2 n=1 Tax=Elaeis guineensis var. tenera TaxID=51953 RepID=UPI003C6D418A